MKKLFFVLILLGSILNTKSQIFTGGIKAGLNYNSNGDLIADINNIKISSDGDTGFHLGIFAEMKLPLFLYIRPELVYTHTKSGYAYQGENSDLTIDKIDAPILVGLRFLKIARVYLGPSFQYIIDTDLSFTDQFSDLTKKSSTDFSVGANFGVAIELGKFGVDFRWERGLSDSESKYTASVIEDNDINISVDTRPEQFILSIYYKFK